MKIYYTLVQLSSCDGSPTLPCESLHATRNEAKLSWEKLHDSAKPLTTIAKVVMLPENPVQVLCRYAVIARDGHCFIPAGYFTSDEKAMATYPGHQGVVRLDATKRIAIV